ncbi:unnamed protein product [Orchesella dallaii]|uniref:glucan endo-1,3-beta-D-glucosidase n=1 Tax=Orchesella dallaii TaxID=48710 RepID=A0ABP1R0E3_9HEXA
MKVSAKIVFYLLSYVPFLASAQDINYFGAAYSPYVKSDGSHWNSYSLEDIKKMMRIMLTYHNAISTYSMGVNQWNVDGPWDKADSNCLIARAAAEVNRDYNTVVLSVSIGIFQNDDPNIQQKEIDNAFLAAEDANRIRAGTVWGLVFTNEYVGAGNAGQKVLNMIQSNKARAQSMGLKVGTRTQICTQIWNGQNREILIEIAKASDFIMCNLYPEQNSDNADAAVKGISDAYYSSRDGFRQHNGNLEVIIGETGWASGGETNPPQVNTVQNQKDFWNAMKNWAASNRVKVHMFEAFDEPWKTGPSGEKELGWWKRAPDNSNYYIEKSTGKRFD